MHVILENGMNELALDSKQETCYHNLASDRKIWCAPRGNSCLIDTNAFQ